MRIPVIVALALICSNSIAAEEIDKKWELGLGIGDITSPDYESKKDLGIFPRPDTRAPLPAAERSVEAGGWQSE